MGSAFFLLIGECLLLAGPGVALAFMIGGVSCLITCFCFAELASRIPSNGGQYTYIYIYYGQYLAWISFCLLTLEYGMSAALNAIGFVHSIKQAFHHYGIDLPMWIFELPVGTMKISVVSGLTVIGLTLFLLRGVEDSIKLNNIMTMAIMLFFFFCTGATYANFDEKNLETYKDGAGTVTGIFKASCICYFAFTSFEQPITVSEEAVRPKKDIPFTLII